MFQRFFKIPHNAAKESSDKKSLPRCPFYNSTKSIVSIWRGRGQVVVLQSSTHCSDILGGNHEVTMFVESVPKAVFIHRCNPNIAIVCERVP